MNAAWKQDPRLKNMNPEKLNYLTKLAETVEQTPKDKLMPLFMSMAAGSSQFQFTDCLLYTSSRHPSFPWKQQKLLSDLPLDFPTKYMESWRTRSF